MYVEFCGAAQVVTGSMHLVHLDGKKILLDCGLYQGNRKAAFGINRSFSFDPATVDAVVLSHAHIDHSGNLPSLVKHGFKGKVYCTDATRTLCSEMLLDSARIQESDVRYVNKYRKRDGKALFEPLYTQPNAVAAIKAFRGKPYHETFTVVPGVECTFYDAGHMLGSASVRLEITSKDGAKKCLVFSGDIGRFEKPVLRDPEIVAGADYVIMEATYGDRFHDDNENTREELLKICQNVHKNNGKLIIPAFSIGRTQLIVYLLDQLVEAGRLPKFKVFVDSPLAIRATDAYRQHLECFDEQYISDLLAEEDQDPLGFRDLFYTRTTQQSKLINTLDEPVIIISASGMCEAGRILHHLKNNIEDPSTHILFAGYQAHNTLGRKILEGEKNVRIFGRSYQVKASSSRLESASGHGDQKELLHWLDGVRKEGDIKRLALVHCEPRPAAALAKEIKGMGVPDVLIPKKGDRMELG